MDKRERILAALDNRRVDRIPYAMWRHYYAQDRTAEGLAQATVEFYQQYDSDMIVINPGPFYLAEGWGIDIRSFGNDETPPYIVSPTVARATDWRQLTELNVPACSLRREIQAVQLVKKRLGEDTVPVLLALPNPLTTANALCDGRIIQDMRSFSNDLRSGLTVIAQATRNLALACLDAGADGFLLINRLNSQETIRYREFKDFGLQFDLQVLEPLTRRNAIRIVSMEGDHTFFDLIGQYLTQAVCWETWHADPSLAVARRQVRCALMGGLNPATFCDGRAQDIQAQIGDAINQTGGWHAIISPSVPLPVNAQPDLLALVGQTIRQS